VVDDEPLIRRLNSDVLTTAGYQVDTAADGVAAWDLLELNDYDLLITDHDMPKLKGLELLKKVRNTGMILPVIMATGTLPFEELSRHLWLQPVVTLLKPYGLTDFLDAVKVVLRATVSDSESIALPAMREDGPAGFQLCY
jgi:DNA-binding response OmpR family regulator